MSSHDTTPDSLDLAAVARGRKTVVALAIVVVANAIPDLAGSYSTHGLSWSLLSTRALAAVYAGRAVFEVTPSWRYWDAGLVAILGIAFLISPEAGSAGGFELARTALAWATIGGAIVIAVSPDVAEYGKTNVRPTDDGALLGLGIDEDKGAKVS